MSVESPKFSLAHLPGALDQRADLLVVGQLAEASASSKVIREGIRALSRGGPEAGCREARLPVRTPGPLVASGHGASEERRAAPAGAAALPGRPGGRRPSPSAPRSATAPRAASPSVADARCRRRSWPGERIVVGFDGTERAAGGCGGRSATGGSPASSSSPTTSPAARPGRRLIAAAAGDPPAAGAARPAAGDDRPGGRPGEAGRAARRPPRRRQMGARGAAFSREQGARTARQPARRSASTSTSPRCSTSPAPAATIADTERGFGSTARAGRRDRGPFAAACRTAASRPPPSTSPASARRSENTDFAVQRIGLSKATLRGVDEAPYRASSPPAASW